MTLALNGRITLLCGLLATSGAFAGEPLQVTLSADEYDGICDAHCSLRDAITAANQAGGAQHIRLAPGNHVLSRPSLPDASGLAGDEDDNLDGDVDVLGELTIQGSGEEQTRIISQVESRLFEVRPGARLSLLRLSLENGRSGTQRQCADLCLDVPAQHGDGAVLRQQLRPRRCHLQYRDGAAEAEQQHPEQ